MQDLFHSPTVGLVGLALDASTQRQYAIAHNIANANTAGYRPLGVSFESQLAEVRNALSSGDRVRDSMLAGISPAIVVRSDDESSPASLDMEVAALSENTLHYQALLRVLNRQLSMLSTAVGDGRR